MRGTRAEAAPPGDMPEAAETATPAIGIPSLAAVKTQHNVALEPYNADPSGNTDSSNAFQAALTAISKAGKGVLYVPAGNYLLAQPLTCVDAAVTMTGDGSGSSVLVITHTQAALTFTCNSMAMCVTMRDIGFTPVPSSGGTAGTAIAITHPDQSSGWPGCFIENVDLGVPYPNYTCFQTGLALTNLWRGHFENVNWHSNIGAVRSSCFAVLGGTCIDNSFRGCTIDGVGNGFVLDAYAEGLHIIDCVVIGTIGVTTGAKAYSGNGVGSPFVNLLGLYISGSEFNTSACSLNLYLVDTAWISNSHFSNRTAGYAAVQITGSTLLHITACSMTGGFNASSPQIFYGVATATTAGGASTTGIAVDDCDFTNLSSGVYYGPGTYNSTATDMRMFSPGNASLISVSLAVNGVTLYAEQDESGNTTNTSINVGSAVVHNLGGTKLAYSRP